MSARMSTILEEKRSLRNGEKQNPKSFPYLHGKLNFQTSLQSVALITDFLHFLKLRMPISHLLETTNVWSYCLLNQKAPNI